MDLRWCRSTKGEGQPTRGHILDFEKSMVRRKLGCSNISADAGVSIEKSCWADACAKKGWVVLASYVTLCAPLGQARARGIGGRRRGVDCDCAVDCDCFRLRAAVKGEREACG